MSGTRAWVRSLALFWLAGFAGCGDDASGARDTANAGIATPNDKGGFGNPATMTGSGGSSSDHTGSDADGAPILPPEMEVKVDFGQPQASERFVYAANPDTDTVSIIDAQTQAIQTLETGDQPTFLRTLAGTDDAIVLNVGSDDATILRSPKTPPAQVSKVAVVHGANAIGVAPDGKHAVVYFDSSASAGRAPTGSVLQDVTVVTLAPGEDQAIGMTVGFRPRDVAFAADGSKAYVVTDDGVSVLDFERVEKEGTGIAHLVSLGADIDQKSADVSVTADGRFALAREPGKSTIRLVDLDSGEIHALDLKDVDYGDAMLDDGVDAGAAPEASAEVSDLDLAPNGEFALAAVRDHSSVVQIPVPDGFQHPEKIEAHLIADEIIGSVTISPNSDRALLYTTAADAERITSLALTKDSKPKTIALRKTVQAVAFAPDGETALIVHRKLPGDPNEAGIDPDMQIDRAFGYSVLRVSSGDVKLQVTPVSPAAFTIVPDGSFLFVMLRDDNTGVRQVQKIEAKSFLVQPIELGSPPLSLGSVPKSKRMFVNQDHPDGRITFIDWETGDTRTVTGFELNSRIRD